MKHRVYYFFLMLALVTGAGAAARAQDADEPVVVAAAPVLTSHDLLSQLQRFLAQRELDVSTLAVDTVAGVMLDWVRFAPIAAGGGSALTDELVYQYGGWSEGCATGFKLSLLRKVSGTGAAGESFNLTAGITLLFDPGANTRLEPFRLASSEVGSIEEFLTAIERSPGFVKLVRETPMSVFIERGGMR